MRPQCGLRAELTEAAARAARKSPVSRTNQKTVRWAVFCLCIYFVKGKMYFEYVFPFSDQLDLFCDNFTGPCVDSANFENVGISKFSQFACSLFRAVSAAAVYEDLLILVGEIWNR